MLQKEVGKLGDGEDKDQVEEQFDEAGAGVTAMPVPEQVRRHRIPTLR
jgi:hypothetical protein